MKQLSCAQCRQHWDDLISKSTFSADSPETAAVQAHLESCAECRRAFELLVAARHEMQQFPAPAAPAALRANIRAQISAPPRRAAWLESLGAFFRSPQKMAWAGSCAVALFLVAFLIRPENQSAVITETPKVLSNRQQIAEQNQQHEDATQTQATSEDSAANTPQPQPTPAPSLKAKTPSSAKSAVTPQPRKQSSARPAASKPQRPRRHSSAKSPEKAPAKSPVQPAPKVTPQTPTRRTAPATPPQTLKSTPAPAITADNMPTAKENTRAPIVQHYGAPAPAEASKDAAATARADSTDLQRHAPPSPMAAKGPAGPAAAPRMHRQRSATTPIAWQQNITFKEDVKNAEIYAELSPALSFVPSGKDSTSKQLVWKGQMQKGETISLHLSLQKNTETDASNEAASVQLTAQNAETQKVLWEKKFEINAPAADR